MYETQNNKITTRNKAEATIVLYRVVGKRCNTETDREKDVVLIVVSKHARILDTIRVSD